MVSWWLKFRKENYTYTWPCKSVHISVFKSRSGTQFNHLAHLTHNNNSTKCLILAQLDPSTMTTVSLTRDDSCFRDKASQLFSNSCKRPEHSGEGMPALCPGAPWVRYVMPKEKWSLLIKNCMSLEGIKVVCTDFWELYWLTIG